MSTQRINKGTLGTSLANIDAAAVASGKIRVIKAITLCNKNASTRWVTITFAGTTVIHQYIIPGIGGENTITIPFMDQVMNATERIQGQCEAATSVDYYISGKEY